MRRSKSIQLFEEFVQQIEAGRLREGARLPTHRELAKAKRVSLSVVNRVYGELARRGLAKPAGRLGTLVTARAGSSATLHWPSGPDASETIDLSHNYVMSAELNRAIKTLSLSAVTDHWDRSGPAASDSFVSQVGQRWLSMLAINAPASAVIGCSGGQHGILACLLAFVGHGGQVAADPFTYTGVKLAAAVLGINLVRVPADQDGMIPEELDRIAKSDHVKAVYLMPSFHNPLAITIPEERRRRIAEVCERNDLFVIEDDPHRCLTARTHASFLELLPGRCAHVTTMSKILGSGVRLGFVGTDSRNALRLQSAIRSANWTSPGVETWVVASALDTVLPRSLVELKAEAAQRQAIARDILKRHQVLASPNAPHLCLVLTQDWTSSQLSSVAQDLGVRISAGASYATDKSADPDFDFVRVSLMSEVSEARLIAGLRRLNELASASPAAFLSSS